jgi:hypothetical protein
MRASGENAYYRWFNEIEPEYWFGLSTDKEHTLPTHLVRLFCGRQ